MNRAIVFLLAFSAAAPLAIAANAPPVIKTQIANQTFYAGVTAKIDLTNAFNDPDTNAVRFSTVQGNFDRPTFHRAKADHGGEFSEVRRSGPLFQNRSDDASPRLGFLSSHDSKLRRSRWRIYRNGQHVRSNTCGANATGDVSSRFRTSPAFQTNAARSRWRNWPVIQTAPLPNGSLT